MTPWSELRERARRDGSAPLVTYVDLATSARAELSAASLDNAVAKTAGLLRDELDVEPGDRIGIDLPLHWQWAVWLGAASAVGAVLSPGGIDEDSEATLLVAAAGAEFDAPAGPETVLVSLHPLGLPEGITPPGQVDHALAARTHPDVFEPFDPPDPDAPLLDIDGRVLSAREAAALARDSRAARGVAPGGRLLLRDDRDMALAPFSLLLGLPGSVLLVRHADQGDVARVALEERASG